MFLAGAQGLCTTHVHAVWNHKCKLDQNGGGFYMPTLTKSHQKLMKFYEISNHRKYMLSKKTGFLVAGQGGFKFYLI